MAKALKAGVIATPAADQTVDEVITLEIAGQVVATCLMSDVGGQAGDLALRYFTEFIFVAAGPININDDQINFINDLYDVPGGIDYNVVIDRIEVGGLAFETEAPSVFSTGTWRAEDGLVPDFR